MTLAPLCTPQVPLTCLASPPQTRRSPKDWAAPARAVAHLPTHPLLLTHEKAEAQRGR